MKSLSACVPSAPVRLWDLPGRDRVWDSLSEQFQDVGRCAVPLSMFGLPVRLGGWDLE
jgi:hypothetical protein